MQFDMECLIYILRIDVHVSVYVYVSFGRYCIIAPKVLLVPEQPLVYTHCVRQFPHLSPLLSSLQKPGTRIQPSSCHERAKLYIPMYVYERENEIQNEKKK